MTGAIASVIFVYGFHIEQENSRSTTCWASGRCTACSAPGAASPPASSAQEALGGLGGVTLVSQLLGTAAAIAFALANGFLVYGVARQDGRHQARPGGRVPGADFSIHNIGAYPEDHIR